MNSNYSNLLDMRNLQEQVEKGFFYQKLFWPFTVWINCSSDLKSFTNSQPSALKLKIFPWSLDQFFLTVGQNNFDNKMPFLCLLFLVQFIKSCLILPAHILSRVFKTAKHLEVKNFNVTWSLHFQWSRKTFEAENLQKIIDH